MRLSTEPAFRSALGPTCSHPVEEVPACIHCLTAGGVLSDGRLPALDDEEGERIPDDLPPVVDAHVHIFADPLFAAIWRWFDQHGWPIRYRLPSVEVAPFLLGRGVEHVIALHYAHKPGIARGMNAFLAAALENEPRATGVATVYPGEPEAGAILEEAFALGLVGVKLHCHVQAFAVDDPKLDEVYEACAKHDMPLVVHAGTEPASPAYPVDPYTLCSVERTERVLQRHPDLKLIVPHLGVGDIERYGELLQRYDNLWLDTTMVLAGYFDIEDPVEVVRSRPERILYGTDFPNLPYAWDRELVRLLRMGLGDADLERVLSGNAKELFRLP
jgi:predicted TIM-barrel fold metal-dependent hydrolase